jgi:PadR family transcriptional regulator PadR
MLEEGWLTDGWEDRADIDGKRPARRYYELTDLGRSELAAAQRAVQTKAASRAMHRPGLAGI